MSHYHSTPVGYHHSGTETGLTRELHIYVYTYGGDFTSHYGSVQFDWGSYYLDLGGGGYDFCNEEKLMCMSWDVHHINKTFFYIYRVYTILIDNCVFNTQASACVKP